MKKTTGILIAVGIFGGVLLMMSGRHSNKAIVNVGDRITTDAVIHSYTACITEPQPCGKSIEVCGQFPDRKVPDYLLPAVK